VSSLRSEIVDLETQLATSRAILTATTTEADTLRGTVTSLESYISSLNTTVNDLDLTSLITTIFFPEWSTM